MTIANVKIEKWPAGKQAAVVVALEGWSPGHAAVALPALNRRGVPATFFVTLDNFKAGPSLDHWATLQQLVRQGHEAGNATQRYLDLTTLSNAALTGEVTDTQELLQDRLYGTAVETFCYPNHSYDSRVIDEVRRRHIGAVVANRDVQEMDFSYDFAAADDYYRIRTLRINQHMTPAVFENRLRQTLRKNGLMTCLLHGVYSDTHLQDVAWFDPIHEDRFEQLLEILCRERDRIWTTTLRDAIRYHRLANAASCHLSNAGPGQIDITLSARAASPAADLPLTVTLTKRDDFSCNEIRQHHRALPFVETASWVRFDVGLGTSTVFIEASPRSKRRRTIRRSDILAGAAICPESG